MKINFCRKKKTKVLFPLPHSGKRSQEPAPKENIVQKKEKYLFLPRTNENNKSTKSQNLPGNKQSMNEDYSISSKANAHSDLKMSIYPESTGKHGAEDRALVPSKLKTTKKDMAQLSSEIRCTTEWSPGL